MGTDIGRRSYLHLQDENGNLIESGIPAGLTSTYTIRGVAVADYDRDGWSDAALWSSSGSNPGIQLYRNDSESSNGLSHFLTLDLQGDPSLPGPLKSTRDAIGARVYITADFNGDGSIGTDETRIEEVLSGHSNASTTSSLALEFGLGLATTADVRIVWGSGHQTRMDNVAADQFLTIVEAFPPGDFDFDEDLDGEDIDLLVAAIADGAADAALFDLTGDGLVNLQDRDEWLALAGSRNLASGSSYLIGDANLDGIVDGQDFVVWNTNKFSNTAAWTAGDFSADGIVDGQDFVLWNLNKFTSAAFGRECQYHSLRRPPWSTIAVRHVQPRSQRAASPNWLPRIREHANIGLVVRSPNGVVRRPCHSRVNANGTSGSLRSSAFSAVPTLRQC